MFIRIFLIFTSVYLASSLSFSAYESFADLRDNLEKAGYPVIMRVGAGDFGADIYVQGHEHSVSIDDYVNSNLDHRDRRPSFDFVDPDSGKVLAEGYRVADVFICYLELSRSRLLKRRLFEATKASPDYVLAENFDLCLIIPAPIIEVEKALARIQSPTAIDSDEERQSSEN